MKSFLLLIVFGLAVVGLPHGVQADEGPYDIVILGGRVMDPETQLPPRNRAAFCIWLRSSSELSSDSS